MCQEVHVYVYMCVEARDQPRVSFLRSLLLKCVGLRSLFGMMGFQIMLGGWPVSLKDPARVSSPQH